MKWSPVLLSLLAIGCTREAAVPPGAPMSAIVEFIRNWISERDKANVAV